MGCARKLYNMPGPNAAIYMPSVYCMYMYNRLCPNTFDQCASLAISFRRDQGITGDIRITRMEETGEQERYIEYDEDEGVYRIALHTE